MPRLPFSKRSQARQASSRRSQASNNRLFRRSLVAGLETLESRQLLAADLLFADSFETGNNSNDWNGAWVEDSQNDWFRSTQRSTDGIRSAEVDGYANNATLKMSNPVDLTGYDTATLTFDWLIESGFDSGEYLALDISSDGGTSWNTSVLQLDGNIDPENQWQSETVDLTPYASSNLVVQFRSKVSRSNEDANVDNVRITGEKSGPEFPPTISYPDFSDPAGLTLLGDAAIANGNTLRLTPAAGSMEGAAWHAEKQFVSVDWETTFEFNLNENVGDVGGSDGFTFVIQNHAPAYLAGGGGTLGYNALPNSLVIEFDTFQNSESSDPSQSHISVHTNGTGPNGWDEALSIGSFDTLSPIDDATTHNVKIRYVSGQLQVFYDGSAAPVISAAVDIGELLELDAGKAWLGFTAATGGGYQNHDILNWEYGFLVDTSSTVSVSNASVVEGNEGTSDLVFNVVREGDTTAPTTVDWSLVSGSATPGVDYVNGSGKLSFAAGEAVKPIVVQVNGDLAEEDDETLRVQLGELSSGILVVDEAVGTILNDDTSVSISDVTVTEGDETLSRLGNFVSEGSGGAVVPRHLNFGPDGNGDGAQDLYVVSSYTREVLRYDGNTGDFLDVFITEEPELNTPFDFAFSPENGDLYILSLIDGGAGVLRFDDITGDLIETVITGVDAAWGLSFVGSGVNYGDLLLTDRAQDRVLRYDGSTLTEFVTPGSGGLDNPRNAVTGPDGDLYVASRDTQQVLKYSGDDGEFESVVTDIPLSTISHIEFGSDGLLYASGRTTDVCCDTTLLQIDVENGSILQTLPLESGGWAFTVGPNNLIYNSGQSSGNFVDVYGPTSNASFTVELSKPSAFPVTVDFTTLGGSANEGLDYLPKSGKITFEPGVTSRTIIVPTFDDAAQEETENFKLVLSNAIGATLVVSEADGTILDDGDVGNQAPTSNAGADQTLSDNDGTGSESVTLVGTAADSDGTIASVQWSDASGTLGTSNTLNTSLPVGVHTLTFTAIDNEGASSSDSVIVTVVANQVPSANAGADQSASDNDGSGDQSVTLNGIGADSDGTIASYQWSDGTSVLGNSASLTTVLGVGTHALTLTVTDNGGATATDTVVVTVAANQAPTALAGADQTANDQDDDGFETVTLIGSGSDDDGWIASYQWSDGANVIGSTASITPTLAVGTHTLTLTVTDNGGATATDAVTVTVEAATTGPNLSHGNVASVGSSWQTVSLGTSYGSAVIVATPRYNIGSGPGVVRISNVTATTFDVRVDNAGSSSFSGGVHFIAMEEGVYDVPGKYKLEAVKVDAPTTSGKTGGWQIGSQGYQQTYSSPVVVGQVMSANDEDWSVFWSSSSSRTSPANSGSLNIGKHVGEDTDSERAPETLGYFVIESTGSGTIDGLAFTAGVGSDTIRGVGNGTYQYSGATPAGATTAVMSTAGMDGGDGGWAALIGNDPVPLASGTITLAVDEDQIRDSERNHTTEQVAYFVIGASVGEGEESGLNAGGLPEITIHNPLDVNGDGYTSPIDALQVINRLNAGTATEEGDMALDTNGDGYVSPIDALLVINRLNASVDSSAAPSLSNAQAFDGYFAELEDDEDKESIWGLELI